MLSASSGAVRRNQASQADTYPIASAATLEEACDIAIRNHEEKKARHEKA